MVDKVKIARGTRTARVTIPSTAKAGAAKLSLTLKDAAGSPRHAHLTGAWCTRKGDPR